MRYLTGILFLFFSTLCFSQKKGFTVHRIAMPPELSYYDNQFSSLYIHDDKLFLMSESRLEDAAEPKLYSVTLQALEHKMRDTSFPLPYQKYHIYNLDLLRKKMAENGDDYEGLEAMVIDGDDVYLSVETATPSNNCYLLKGHLNYTDVVMDPEIMMALKKPVDAKNAHIYNAGFEAVGLLDNKLYSFFEYNSFPQENYVKMIPTESFARGGEYHPVFTDRIPFRVTDITVTGTNEFTGINYFYKGGGKDAIYRVPPKESSADRLIKDSTGGYHSYCRLVDISFNGNMFTWKTLWEFPEEYWGYNWEGIASYKDGYFITNDKYTPATPYISTLLYLSKDE